MAEGIMGVAMAAMVSVMAVHLKAGFALSYHTPRPVSMRALPAAAVGAGPDGG